MGIPTGRRLSIATLDSDGEELVRNILEAGGLLVGVEKWLYATNRFRVRFQDGESQIFTFLYIDGLTSGQRITDAYTLSRTITILLNGVWSFSCAQVLYTGTINLAPWTDDMKPHWQHVQKWIVKNFSKYRVKSSSREVVYVGPEAMRWREQVGNYLFGDWSELPSREISSRYPSRAMRNCSGDLVVSPR